MAGGGVEFPLAEQRTADLELLEALVGLVAERTVDGQCLGRGGMGLLEFAEIVEQAGPGADHR